MNPEELKTQLSELKNSLKTALHADLKENIKDEIKYLEAKLNGFASSEDVKAASTKIETVSTELGEVKTSMGKIIEAQDQMLASQKAVQAKAEKAKSFNDQLAEAINEGVASIEAFKSKKSRSALIDFKAAGDMTFGANFTNAALTVTQVRPGIIQQPSRKLHIRDLLQMGTLGTSDYAYVKETGGEGNPATFAEGGFKEQFDFDITEATAPSQYIAGYLRISTKMMDDVPGLITFLQQRSLEKLLRAEDVQLLYGNGVSPNLAGLTNAGNFTAPASAATIDVEQIIEAISQLEMGDREATAVLVSPKDYYRMLLYKASTSGEYTLPGNSGLVVVQNGQVYIAGKPVYRSTAMLTDKFLVGDWVMGASLLTREAPRIEFFYEDGTNVRENKVTVRIEERIAFPVYGSDYFIYGDLGNS